MTVLKILRQKIIPKISKVFTVVINLNPSNSWFNGVLLRPCILKPGLGTFVERCFLPLKFVFVLISPFPYHYSFRWSSLIIKFMYLFSMKLLAYQLICGSWSNFSSFLYPMKYLKIFFFPFLRIFVYINSLYIRIF